MGASSRDLDGERRGRKGIVIRIPSPFPSVFRMNGVSRSPVSLRVPLHAGRTC